MGWIQKATTRMKKKGTVGSLRRLAKSAGMSVREYCSSHNSRKCNFYHALHGKYEGGMIDDDLFPLPDDYCIECEDGGNILDIIGQVGSLTGTPVGMGISAAAQAIDLAQSLSRNPADYIPARMNDGIGYAEGGDTGPGDPMDETTKRQLIMSKEMVDHWVNESRYFNNRSPHRTIQFDNMVRDAFYSRDKYNRMVDTMGVENRARLAAMNMPGYIHLQTRTIKDPNSLFGSKINVLEKDTFKNRSDVPTARDYAEKVLGAPSSLQRANGGDTYIDDDAVEIEGNSGIDTNFRMVNDKPVMLTKGEIVKNEEGGNAYVFSNSREDMPHPYTNESFSETVKPVMKALATSKKRSQANYTDPIDRKTVGHLEQMVEIQKGLESDRRQQNRQKAAQSYVEGFQEGGPILNRPGIEKIMNDWDRQRYAMENIYLEQMDAHPMKNLLYRTQMKNEGKGPGFSIFDAERADDFWRKSRTLTNKMIDRLNPDQLRLGPNFRPATETETTNTYTIGDEFIPTVTASRINNPTTPIVPAAATVASTPNTNVPRYLNPGTKPDPYNVDALIDNLTSGLTKAPYRLPDTQQGAKQPDTGIDETQLGLTPEDKIFMGIKGLETIGRVAGALQPVRKYRSEPYEIDRIRYNPQEVLDKNQATYRAVLQDINTGNANIDRILMGNYASAKMQQDREASRQYANMQGQADLQVSQANSAIRQQINQINEQIEARKYAAREAALSSIGNLGSIFQQAGAARAHNSITAATVNSLSRHYGIPEEELMNLINWNKKKPSNIVQKTKER